MTGYRLVTSKSAGRYRTPYKSVVPSAAFTRKGSGGVYPPDASGAVDACPRRLIDVPSVRRSSMVRGSVRLEYVSTKKLPDDENTGSCCPGVEVNVVNPVPSNPTR